MLKYMPLNLTDHLMDRYSIFEKGLMTVVEYEDCFDEFTWQTTFTLDTENERDCGFVWGLRLSLYISTQSLVFMDR